MSSRNPKQIRELEQAFVAARNAGFVEVEVAIATKEGRTVYVTARLHVDRSGPTMTPLEAWRLKRDAS